MQADFIDETSDNCNHTAGVFSLTAWGSSTTSLISPRLLRFNSRTALLTICVDLANNLSYIRDKVIRALRES